MNTQMLRIPRLERLLMCHLNSSYVIHGKSNMIFKSTIKLQSQAYLSCKRLEVGKPEAYEPEHWNRELLLRRTTIDEILDKLNTERYVRIMV